MKNQNRRTKTYFHYQKEIINTISEPASFISPEYKYVFVNNAFNHFHNIQTTKIIGKTVADLWSREIFDTCIKPHVDRCLKGEDVFFQYEGKMQDGQIKTIEINFYPHREKNGKINGVIETMTDITEKKQAEKTLQNSEHRLKELNAAKDKLFSVIGHDLKGPLNNILGFAELIDNDYNKYTPEEIQHYNRLILQSARSLYNLLDNLLTWSRTQNKKVSASPQEVIIQFVVQQCQELLNPSAEKKQIQFINKIPPETIVFADLEMLTVVFRNLMSNAIKFTNRGGKITTSIETNGQSVIIGICDTGIGISEEKIQHLFHPETNFSTPGTARERGTGLGLVICRDFIRKNDGEIWVESEPGKGSCFYFSLPKKETIQQKIGESFFTKDEHFAF